MAAVKGRLMNRSPEKNDPSGDEDDAKGLALACIAVMPMAALLIDDQETIITASPMARDQFKISPDDPVKMHKLFPTLSREELSTCLSLATVESPRPMQLIAWSEADVASLTVTIAPWPGTGLYLCCFVQRQVLSNDQEELSSIIDNYVQGVLVHRGERPFYVNETMARMVDQPSTDKLLARPISDWIHPEDQDMVQCHIEMRLRGELVPELYEFRLLPQDGREIWVESRETIVSWQGEPAVLTSLSDITERLRAHKSRERAHMLFRRIFETQPNAATLTNAVTGRYRDMNDAFTRILGWTWDEVIGRTPHDLNIWHDPQEHASILKDIDAGRRVEDRIVTMNRRDKKPLKMALTVEKITMDQEEGLLLMIARDVTDEVMSAQALRRSRDAAELANRTKSEFLANMSHELRTPLNAILGFSEILKSQTLGPIGSPRYAEYSEDIYRSGRHLLDIINDILDLSKVEAGRIELHEDRVDLSEVFQQCQRLIRERAQNAGVYLDVAVDDDLPQIWSDPRLLKQILLNLLSNAVKFTLLDGAVSLRCIEEDDGAITLEVADTGIGMSEEDIQVALTPFGQVDSTLTRMNSGTGLGLPLVSAFCQLLEYHLAINSEKDVGTSIRITVPADKIAGSGSDY